MPHSTRKKIVCSCGPPGLLNARKFGQHTVSSLQVERNPPPPYVTPTLSRHVDVAFLNPECIFNASKNPLGSGCVFFKELQERKARALANETRCFFPTNVQTRNLENDHSISFVALVNTNQINLPHHRPKTGRDNATFVPSSRYWSSSAFS